MSLDAITYRMATDPEFASQLQEDPEAAIENSGLHIGRDDLSAIKAVLSSNSTVTSLVSPENVPEDMLPWASE